MAAVRPRRGARPLRAEAALALGCWALYEAARGLVAANRAAAVRHAHEVAGLERALGLFVERDVQRAVEAVPGAIPALGAAYLTLHLGVTAGVLVWLHRRRPEAFALVRTTLLAATGIALAAAALFPTAPPRLAGVGIADTVSHGPIDLDHGLVRSLYDPFAAVPSMHVGFAVVVAAVLLHEARQRAVRAAAALYPPLVVLAVVATGNHFLLDAAAGCAAAAAGFALARALHRAP